MAPSRTRVRGRSLFRQADVVKAMRSVRSAKEDGFEIGGVEVSPDGTIRVFAKSKVLDTAPEDEWDEALK